MQSSKIVIIFILVCNMPRYVSEKEIYSEFLFLVDYIVIDKSFYNNINQEISIVL